MRRFLPLLLLSAACGQPLAIKIRDTREDPDTDVILDACDVLEIECVEAQHSDGALTLILTDNDDSDTNVEGENFDRPCRPVSWSSGSDPYILAHEIGHAMGLEHVDDPDRLMYTTAGTLTTHRELATVWRHVDRLAACAGGA